MTRGRRTTWHFAIMAYIMQMALSVVATRLSLAAGPALELPDIHTLDASILGHRRAITSGQVRITSKYVKDGVPQSTTTYTIYNDGTHVRQDVTENGVTRVQSFGKEYFYIWCDTPPMGGRYALQATALSYVSRDDRTIQDFRKLMFMPSWFEGTAHLSLDSVVGSPNRSQVKLANVIWEGETAIRVSCADVDDPSWQVWYEYTVVPSRDYNIVRFQAHAKPPKAPEFVDLVTASLQPIAGGKWFPKTIRYTRTKKNHEEMRQELDIKVLSLNEPIDIESFEPATMNVPMNTIVSRVPGDPRGPLKWNGSNIVAMNNKDRAEILFGGGHPRSDSRSRRVVLFGISGVLLVAALAVAFGRRKSAGKQP